MKHYIHINTPTYEGSEDADWRISLENDNNVFGPEKSEVVE